MGVGGTIGSQLPLLVVNGNKRVVRPADETAKTEAPSRNQCLEMRGTVIQRLDFFKNYF